MGNKLPNGTQTTIYLDDISRSIIAEQPPGFSLSAFIREKLKGLKQPTKKQR